MRKGLLAAALIAFTCPLGLAQECSPGGAAEEVAPTCAPGDDGDGECCPGEAAASPTLEVGDPTGAAAGVPSAEPTAPGAAVLLVTSAELAPAWAEFAAWKTRSGKPTKVVTTEQIAASYPGADLPARIKACVLEHVADAGTRWVVLGGDSLPGGDGVVPDRDTPHRIYGRQQYRDIPTDLYYVTEGSWDADGDGVYGDWRTDREAISWESRAAIGRIPVQTAAQVAAYTEKVIAYERRYPTADFAEKLLYTCAVPMANYKADLLWDENLAAAWAGGDFLRFFVDRSPWDAERRGDYDLSPAHWVERLNGRTAGKMHMHGHGLLECWVLERNALATREVIEQLDHEDAYLVMTTVSCFTGHYDDREDPSVAEAMLRRPRGGAVVVVAPSRPGVPVFPGWGRDPRDGRTQDGTTALLTRFWVHGLGGGLTAGEAFAAARADFAAAAREFEGFHWTTCEINLLGDPTLDLRASDPFTPEVVVSEALRAREASEVTVAAGAPGLTVCLWKPDEDLYAVATTGPDGRATLAVEPAERGELHLTVSGPSANTVTRELRVRSRWFK